MPSRSSAPLGGRYQLGLTKESLYKNGQAHDARFVERFSIPVLIRPTRNRSL